MEKQNHLIKRLCADARTPLSQSSPSVCWISTSPTVSERGRGSSARWQRWSREGGLFVNLKKIKKKTKKKKRDDMHIKQRKNKKWKTLFLKTASGFLCLFLTFCLRSEGSSFSVSVKVRGHRRWRPKVTGWVKCREQRDEDEEEGGAAACDEPPSLSLRHRERGGGKRVSENMKTNTKTTN